MVTLYSLIIYAKDSHGATASQTILIQIADVNEPPTFRGALAQRDQGTELSSWGKKGPLGPWRGCCVLGPLCSRRVMVIGEIRRMMLTK